MEWDIPPGHEAYQEVSVGPGLLSMSSAVVSPAVLISLPGNGMKAVSIGPLERHLQGVRTVRLLEGRETDQRCLRALSLSGQHCCGQCEKPEQTAVCMH